MNILLANRTRKYKINNRKTVLNLLKAAAEISGLAKIVGENDSLDIVLLGDRKMTEINEQFLSHEGSTDVITFDFIEDENPFVDDEGRVVGEIYVCLDTALRAASTYQTAFAHEVVLYCVHGMLHLCGLDDHCDEDIAEMRAGEKRVMTELSAQFNIEELFEVR